MKSAKMKIKIVWLNKDILKIMNQIILESSPFYLYFNQRIGVAKANCREGEGN